jgi:predicted AAA+ superfamily ATPase
MDEQRKAMANTTPWRQVVTPHDNIQQGKVKQNDFAASLADLLHQSGNPDYYDPERFFNRTFLTAGLRQLAGEVVGRLTGQGDGDAVMQIQTPFGGGKTHTLIMDIYVYPSAPYLFNLRMDPMERFDPHRRP